MDELAEDPAEELLEELLEEQLEELLEELLELKRRNLPSTPGILSLEAR